MIESFFVKLALKPTYLLKEQSNMIIVLKSLLNVSQYEYCKIISQKVFNICELFRLVCNHVTPCVHKMVKHGLKRLLARV